MPRRSISGNGVVVSYRALLFVLQRLANQLMALKTLILTADPTGATVGKYGQLACVDNADPSLRSVWVCTVDNGPYTWVKIADNLPVGP